MPGQIDATLASGLWRNGRCLREVRLATPDAAAERTLVDSFAHDIPAARVSALVTAAVEALDGGEPFGLDDARALTIGDRDRVVLALRRVLVGDTMECIVDCACGETLELVVSASTLLGDVAAEPAPLETNGRLRVRAATGADHERAALRALDDPDAAARELVSACIVDAERVDDDVIAEASKLLEELDSAAELLLRGACPACGDEIVAALDPGAYLWTELEQRRARLELEVHTLARHYHWSEAEIIALPPERRARYIELIDAETGAL